jgi:hypothetical protein
MFRFLSSLLLTLAFASAIFAPVSMANHHTSGECCNAHKADHCACECPCKGCHEHKPCKIDHDKKPAND